MIDAADPPREMPSAARQDALPPGAVVEWAPFRLAAGASEAALLEASDAIQRDFLRHRPGFLRRELLRGTDGQWADLLHWADDDAASAAMGAAATSEACLAYFRLMDPGDGVGPGVGVLHLHRVRAY